MTMRAVVIDRPGSPEVLSLKEVRRPSPKAHDVLVKVHASGLNRADLLQRRGLYPAPPGSPADIAGLEFAGEVAESPSGEWARGARVMGIVGGGAAAEYLTLPADQLLPTPKHLSDAEAAAIPEAFLTAYDAVVLQGKLQRGEWLALNAAGSGVGTAAIQLARHLGASVVGSSRTVDKLERCEGIGLNEAVLGSSETLAQACERRLGPQAISVILDLVGGAELSNLLRCLDDQGRLILVGLLAGRRATLPLGVILGRRLRVQGTVLRSRSDDEKAALVAAFRRHLLADFSVDGPLRPIIHCTVPWTEVREAHQLLEGNSTFGKVVLTHDS